MTSDAQLPELTGTLWALENHSYSYAELRDLLGGEEDSDLARLVEQLKCAKILRTHRSGQQVEEAWEEGDDDAWEISQLHSALYSFRLVGLLAVHKTALCILPKYCSAATLRDETRRREHFRMVLNVLMRYQKNLRDSGTEAPQDPWQEFLHTMLELVTDYAAHGVYRDDEILHERNGRGRILWHRTISSTQPFLQDGSPLYMELKTRRRQVDEDNYFTRMHRFLTYRAWKNLERAQLRDILELPVMAEPAENEGDFADADYMLSRLRRELNQQYDNRRRYVLQLLMRFLEQKDERSKRGYFCFGNTALNLVWEEACRRALGLAASDDHQMDATRPRWMAGRHPAETFLSAPLRADMLRYTPEDSSLLICDAKYYTPSLQVFQQKKTDGMPGTGDIIKQQLYELALRLHYGTIQSVRNVFLLPLREEDGIADDVSCFGHTSVPMLTGGRMKEILLCKLHPPLVWETYLSDVRDDRLLRTLQEKTDAYLHEGGPRSALVSASLGDACQESAESRMEPDT